MSKTITDALAATDGNHGRAVARVARLLGLPAQISSAPWVDAESCILVLITEGVTDPNANTKIMG